MKAGMTWYDRWLLFGSDRLVPAETDHEHLSARREITVLGADNPKFFEPSTVTQPATVTQLDFRLNWIVEERPGICVINDYAVAKVNFELAKNNS